MREKLKILRALMISAMVACMVAPAFAQQSDDGDISEIDPFGIQWPQRRLEYFYGLRSYPSGVLPSNGWHDAWLAAQELDTFAEPGRVPDMDPNWEFMGPTSTDDGWLGRVHALALHPTDPNTYYLGHAKGGVWKTTDGGTSWTNLTDNLSSQVVGCLTLAPSNPNTIYLGTGEEYFAGGTLAGIGIWKSTDAGATWTLYGNSTFSGKRISDIVIDPANPNKWVVCTDAGIYVTTNGGSTFTLRLSGNGSSLLIDPSNSNIYYAALGYIYGTASNGIYKSVDGGTNWTLQGGGAPSGSTNGRIELAIAPSAPSTVYAIVAGPPNSLLTGVYKTTNGGSTWSTMATPVESRSQGWYDLCIQVAPTDPNTVICGDVDVFRSTNGATSWTKLSIDHTDHHLVRFVPGSNTNFYLGVDAGLYYTTTSGASWIKKNYNRGTMEYYELDVHPTDASRLFAGAQDNATQIRNGTNDNYINVIGGDGFHCAYSKTNPSIMIAEVYYAQAYRSTNAGASWSSCFSPPSGESADWNSPILNDPNTGTTFYIGSSKLYRSTSSGASGTWSAISGNLGKSGAVSSILEIAVQPGNSNVIYAGMEDANIQVTTNGGTTWSSRIAGLPNSKPGGIAVSSTPGTAYVGLMSFGVGHVYKTTDYGVTWANISGNLPDTPVTGIVINPLNTAQLIVATDNGVFICEGDNGVWRKLGFGLPSTRVSSIRANGTTKYLTIATYGRGCWRLPLPQLVSVSGTVTLQGLSAGAPGQSITFQFRDPGSTTTLFTKTVNIGPSGTYSLSGIASGLYSVRIKGPKYLAALIANLNISTGSVTGTNATLLAGDVDNDNVVSVFDYIALSDAFDLSAGDPGWNANADLDGDGVVSVFDYILLSDNFDEQGAD